MVEDFLQVEQQGKFPTRRKHKKEQQFRISKLIQLIWLAHKTCKLGVFRTLSNIYDGAFLRK